MAGIYFEATAFDKRLKNNTVRRCKNITDLYNELIAAAVGYVPASLTAKDVESGFFFKNYPILHKRINALIENLSSNLQTNIEDGNTDAWDVSNSKYDALIELIKAKADKAGVDISQRLQQKWNNHNLSALQAFQDREINGVDLSRRIWNLTQQTKTELELAMEIGIGDGKSAAALSRDVRKYLKDPNKLFRRVRDKKTGQLRLSKAAAAYHPGRGKYRSSYKNALRMTATENNMAYRSADYERNQELDFVLGIEIHLSGNHPVVDICDDLKGKYPKTFKFTGWHPWCRCYTTTILPKQEDMLNYLSMSAEEQAQAPFSGQITDFPDKFKGFITENEERLKNAKSVPLFVQDNKEAVEKILNPKLSIAERAKIRHEQRTEAQKAAIQNAWNERQKKHALINKTANNVLNVAKDYGEVDMSALQAAISSGNIDAMKAEAKSVAKVVAETKKQEQALADLIPDAHLYHKTVSMDELQQTYSAVQSKLQQWASLPLEKQEKKLTFEVVDFLGGNMNNVQDKYPNTWYISQKAYSLQLGKVKYTINTNKLVDNLQAAKAFSQAHPKATKMASLISEFDAALANKESLSDLQLKADAVIKDYNARLSRIAKKSAKANSVTFDSSAFTQKRKNAALWDTGDGTLADKTLADDAAKVWKGATEAEKDAIYDYTVHFCDVNEPLEGRKYYNSQSKAKFTKKVNNMTSYINRSELPCDMWTTRGDLDISVIDSRIRFAGGTPPTNGNLDDYVGMVMQEGGFMSTASRKGEGFKTRDIILNVYAPKGTKATYVEPFSGFGCGKGRNWSGDERFTIFSGEQETLFQRGTKMRITKIYRDNGKIYIDCDIIEQEIKDLSYVRDSDIGY